MAAVKGFPGPFTAELGAAGNQKLHHIAVQPTDGGSVGDEDLACLSGPRLRRCPRQAYPYARP